MKICEENACICDVAFKNETNLKVRNSVGQTVTISYYQRIKTVLQVIFQAAVRSFKSYFAPVNQPKLITTSSVKPDDTVEVKKPKPKPPTATNFAKTVRRILTKNKIKKLLQEAITKRIETAEVALEAKIEETKASAVKLTTKIQEKKLAIEELQKKIASAPKLEAEKKILQSYRNNLKSNKSPNAIIPPPVSAAKDKIEASKKSTIEANKGIEIIEAEISILQDLLKDNETRLTSLKEEEKKGAEWKKEFKIPQETPANKILTPSPQQTKKTEKTTPTPAVVATKTKLDLLLQDLEKYCHSEMKSMWSIFFNRFGAKVIKNWTCSSEGFFTLELSNALKLWVPAKDKDDPVGGTILMLGHPNNIVKGQLINEENKGSIKFDEGFYSYCQYKVSFFVPAMKVDPKMEMMTFESPGTVSFTAGYLSFSRSRTTTLEATKENWKTIGQVVSDGNHEAFLKEKLQHAG